MSCINKICQELAGALQFARQRISVSANKMIAGPESVAGKQACRWIESEEVRLMENACRRQRSHETALANWLDRGRSA